ncbi:hypothetical protein JCM8547_009054 [Rhodosporidiobolus lusitaniae]
MSPQDMDYVGYSYSFGDCLDACKDSDRATYTTCAFNQGSCYGATDIVDLSSSTLSDTDSPCLNACYGSKSDAESGYSCGSDSALLVYTRPTPDTTITHFVQNAAGWQIGSRCIPTNSEDQPISSLTKIETGLGSVRECLQACSTTFVDGVEACYADLAGTWSIYNSGGGVTTDLCSTPCTTKTDEYCGGETGLIGYITFDYSMPDTGYANQPIQFDNGPYPWYLASECISTTSTSKPTTSLSIVGTTDGMVEDCLAICAANDALVCGTTIVDGVQTCYADLAGTWHTSLSGERAYYTDCNIPSLGDKYAYFGGTSGMILYAQYGYMNPIPYANEQVYIAPSYTYYYYWDYTACTNTLPEGAVELSLEQNDLAHCFNSCSDDGATFGSCITAGDRCYGVASSISSVDSPLLDTDTSCLASCTFGSDGEVGMSCGSSSGMLVYRRELPESPSDTTSDIPSETSTSAEPTSTSESTATETTSSSSEPTATTDDSTSTAEPTATPETTTAPEEISTSTSQPTSTADETSTSSTVEETSTSAPEPTETSSSVEATTTSAAAEETSATAVEPTTATEETAASSTITSEPSSATETAATAVPPSSSLAIYQDQHFRQGYSSWVYKGCFPSTLEDGSSRTPRTLSSSEWDGTPDGCLMACLNRDGTGSQFFYYCGLTAGNECVANEAYYLSSVKAVSEAVDDAFCSAPCSGTDYACGADNYVSLYAFDGPAWDNLEIMKSFNEWTYSECTSISNPQDMTYLDRFSGNVQDCLDTCATWPFATFTTCGIASSDCYGATEPLDRSGALLDDTDTESGCLLGCNNPRSDAASGESCADGSAMLLYTRPTPDTVITHFVEYSEEWRINTYCVATDDVDRPISSLTKIETGLGSVKECLQACRAAGAKFCGTTFVEGVEACYADLAGTWSASNSGFAAMADLCSTACSTKTDEYCGGETGLITYTSSDYVAPDTGYANQPTRFYASSYPWELANYCISTTSTSKPISSLTVVGTTDGTVGDCLSICAANDALVCGTTIVDGVQTCYADFQGNWHTYRSGEFVDDVHCNTPSLGDKYAYFGGTDGMIVYRQYAYADPLPYANEQVYIALSYTWYYYWGYTACTNTLPNGAVELSREQNDLASCLKSCSDEGASFGSCITAGDKCYGVASSISSVDSPLSDTDLSCLAPCTHGSDGDAGLSCGSSSGMLVYRRDLPESPSDTTSDIPSETSTSAEPTSTSEPTVTETTSSSSEPTATTDGSTSTAVPTATPETTTMPEETATSTSEPTATADEPSTSSTVKETSTSASEPTETSSSAETITTAAAEETSSTAVEPTTTSDEIAASWTITSAASTATETATSTLTDSETEVVSTDESATSTVESSTETSIHTATDLSAEIPTETSAAPFATATSTGGDNNGTPQQPQTSAPENKVASLDWTYKGCYTDSVSARTLVNGLGSQYWTAENCLSLAAAAGYKYAGIIYGGECWGANEITTGVSQAADACMWHCADGGNDPTTCGGPAGLDVYQTTESIASPSIEPTTTTTSSSESTSTSASTETDASASAPSATATTTTPAPSTLYKKVTDDETYAYKGCYTDSTRARTLLNGLSSNDWTAEHCLSLAASAGYRYAGIIYGGECWGANEITTGVPQAETECNWRCANNAGSDSTTCGGAKGLDVYETRTTITSPPDDAPAGPEAGSDSNGGATTPVVTDSKGKIVSASWSYQGCYTDSVNARTLVQGLGSIEWTADHCLSLAAAAGYKYAGIIYGGECWGANDLLPLATVQSADQCNWKCADDKTGSQTCGGVAGLDVYLARPTAPSGNDAAAPAAERRKRSVVRFF